MNTGASNTQDKGLSIGLAERFSKILHTVI